MLIRADVDFVHGLPVCLFNTAFFWRKQAQSVEIRAKAAEIA
jgi:hypothetical protein